MPAINRKQPHQRLLLARSDEVGGGEDSLLRKPSAAAMERHRDAGEVRYKQY